ncbi:hypothetical protein [Rhizobium sp. BK538]|uniref:hypothetical protein n=1 Tax=Rhizobium sp. BK538 TaxID=2586984 RepID=UPI00160D7A70|nr:hypothetical protein [Rhizobium sp. BK538]MBB4172125.1 hypothetical protein [Rhizobium sp. BK538]
MSKTKAVYSGKLIVRQYSDEQLRSITLTTDDPLSIGQVVHNPPPQDQDMEFVAQYRSAEPVICAFGHHHQRGFLLKDGVGDHYLIGKDCAADHYGLNWEAFAKDVSRSVERQSNLQWLDALSTRVLEAMPKIEAIIASPAVAAFDELRRHVQGLPTPVLDAFRDASGLSHHIWMSATFRERDFAAEERVRDKAYADYEKAQKERAPSSEKTRLKLLMMEANRREIWKTTKRQILKCPAPAVFRSMHKMKPRLEELAKGLQSQATNLLGTLRVSQPSLAARTLSEAARRFDSILREIDDAAAMFSPSTLDALMSLFNGHEFREVRATRLSYGIKFVLSDDEYFVLRLPARLQPMDFSLHDLLHPQG